LKQIHVIDIGSLSPFLMGGRWLNEKILTSHHCTQVRS